MAQEWRMPASTTALHRMVLQKGCKTPGSTTGASASSMEQDDQPLEWSAWVKNCPKPKPTSDTKLAMQRAVQRNAMQKLAHYCELHPEETMRGVVGKSRAVQREGWCGVRKGVRGTSWVWPMGDGLSGLRVARSWGWGSEAQFQQTVVGSSVP